MTELVDRKRRLFRVILGLVVLIGSFVVIREGFYMDEAGLLSTYKPVFQGERLFIDIWGELQLGGLLTYPLFALYYYALEPILTTTGIGFVLYTRICYQIVRLLISIYLYFTIRKTDYKDGAFIAALTYYAFFVSFKNFSYKSMCDFAVVLFFCWAFRYLQTKNVWFFVLMGLSTSVAILAYATMIIFPFFFVIFMIVMTQRGYELVKPIIIFSVTCFICGGLVLVYLQLTAGIQNIIPQLLYVEDQAYGEPAYIRMGKMLLSYVCFFGVAYIPIVVLQVLSIWRNIEYRTIQIVLSVYWILFMGAIIFARLNSVSNARLIYGCLVIFFWFPYFVNKKEKTQYTQVGSYKKPEYDDRASLNLIFVFSLVIQLIWAISTNQEISIPGHMCFYVVVALLMMIEKEFDGLRLLEMAVVACTLFFSLIWMAEGDGGYNDIFEPRTYVTYGAYDGIALSEDDYKNNEDCYNLVTNYITDEDRVFVLHGYNYSAYLNCNAHQGPGPYARAGVGQNRVLQYWEINPEDLPDYIMINTQNKYYSEFIGGETEEYINENYKTTVATEGDFILLAR